MMLRMKGRERRRYNAYLQQQFPKLRACKEVHALAVARNCSHRKTVWSMTILASLFVLPLNNHK